MTPTIKARLKWRAGGAAVLFVLIGGLVVLAPRNRLLRRAFSLACWRVLLRGFRLRVEVHGKPLPEAGTLFVANHISWIDIPVLGRVLESGFVARGDMRAWPILGTLTAAYGCLFVEREQRGKAGDQAAALASHLEAERGLILFPEGTTGLGETVLPFRSSLFALVPGVVDGSARVQPVTLRYRRADGSALSPQEQRAVAWIGDDELMPHAAALSRMGGLVAEVWFEEPVLGANRKVLAKACEEAVAARLRE